MEYSQCNSVSLGPSAVLSGEMHSNFDEIDHYHMNYAATDRKPFVYLGEASKCIESSLRYLTLPSGCFSLHTVGLVALIELSHMGFLTHSEWHRFVIRFEDPSVPSPVSSAGLPTISACCTS